MTDDINQEEGDRSQLAGGDYEIDQIAQEHGIAAEQARELIRLHGNNREALDTAARRTKEYGL